MMRRVISLRTRKWDILIIAFYLLNLLFITYVVDLEQLVIADPNHFTYPIWPPAPLVDLIHTYGRNFDPVLIARPMWWRMTIWIDVLFFGPYYLFAIFAFIQGSEWIRIPAFIHSAMLITNVLIIMGEEIAGSYPTPALPFVTLLNLPWVLVPLVVIYRMATSEHPFSQGGENHEQDSGTKS